MNSTRRLFLRSGLGALAGFLVAGCDRLGASSWFKGVLSAGETISMRAQRFVAPRRSMAQEFSVADLSPHFRSNGSSDPESPDYQALAAHGFAEWSLLVDGLVQQPLRLSLAQLKAMQSRSQITRHDCVEGWSAIAQWRGVPLAAVLDAARPQAGARYAVFHCADPMDGPGSERYYESIDMEDAYHPQTLLAYELNQQPLPIANGAPLRLRVERQLGYKHAKYLMRIELAASLDGIRGGKGGYWEDGYGYQWYAGI
jgi:DMSO/TMAO reductase YedYZ molybdopterin-dependent catalytic subunit